MSIEDTLGYRSDTEACAVCGKNVRAGGGFARVNRDGRMIELCCPLCLETFQRDPTPYLLVRDKIARAVLLRELLKQPEG
jgi:ribosomal protein L24E